MQTRFQTRLAGISLSMLFVIGSPRHAAAIAVENDVEVEWSQGPRGGKHVTGGSARFIGRNDKFTISIDLLQPGSSVNPDRSFLELIFYDENLKELCPTSLQFAPSRPSGTIGNLCHGFFHVSQLPIHDLTLQDFLIVFDSLFAPPFPELPRQHVIITVRGVLAVRGTMSDNDAVRLTISGGDPVIADRVGDLDGVPGGTLDISPRSIELVSEMNQLQTPVELDVTANRGIKRQTGWTHAFPLPGNIKNAKITIQLFDQPPCDVAIQSPCGKDEFIQVHAARCTTTPCGPADTAVILLDDLLACDKRSQDPDDPRRVIVDLMHAPVRLGKEVCPSPMDLTPFMKDDGNGRLNVIVGFGTEPKGVGGLIGVDYSILTVR